MDNAAKLQELSFEIIPSAGDAKAFAYEALAAAKAKDRALYEAKMNEADAAIAQAHHYQFDLLSAEANQELDITFSILLVHAQDHLMTTMTSIELIKEIAEPYLNGSQTK